MSLCVKGQSDSFDVKWGKFNGTKINDKTELVHYNSSLRCNTGLALSSNFLSPNKDGSFSYTIERPYNKMFIGFTPDESLTNYKYAKSFFLYGNRLYVLEFGRIVGYYGVVRQGDDLKLVRSKGKLIYYLNGKQIRASSISYEKGLYIQAGLLNSKSKLSRLTSTFNRELTLRFDVQHLNYLVNKGSITPTLENGVAPISYLWSTGDTSRRLSNLSAGKYSLKITDAVGSEITKEVAVLNVVIWDKFINSKVENQNLVKHNKNRWAHSISLNSLGHGQNGSIEYEIENKFNSLYIGFLANNRIKSYRSLSAEFFIYRQRVYIIESGRWVGSYGTINNGDRLSIQKENGFFNYSINDKLIRKSRVRKESLLYVQAGLLSYNSRLGELLSTFSVPLNISVDVQHINCFGEKGQLDVTLENGMPPISYKWSTGDTSRTLRNVSAGKYSLKVTDSFGNEENKEVEVFNVVMWDEFLNAKVENKQLVKVHAKSRAHAIALNSLDQGQDGAIHYEIENNSNQLYIGFSTSDRVIGYRGLNAAFFIYRQRVYLIENGRWVGRYGTVRKGDRLSIKKENGKFYYSINDKQIRKSNVKNELPLYVHVGLLSRGTKIGSVFSTFSSSNTINIGDDLHLCSGNTTRIGVSNVKTRKYQWSSNESISCDTCSSISITPSVSTFYNLVVTNEYGCKSSDNIFVKIGPVFSAPSTYSVCEGDSIPLEVRGNNRVSWSPQSDLSCYDCLDPVATPSQTKRWSLTVTDDNNCSKTQDVTVNVSKLTEVFVSDDTTIYIGDQANLNLFSNDLLTNISWRPSSIVDCNRCKSVWVNPTQTSTYYVDYTNGICTKTDSILVQINPLSFEEIQSTWDGNNLVLSVNEYENATYSWSAQSRFNKFQLPGSESLVSFTPPYPGYYFIQLEIEAQGRKKVVTKNLKINKNDIPF